MQTLQALWTRHRHCAECKGVSPQSSSLSATAAEKPHCHLPWLLWVEASKGGCCTASTRGGRPKDWCVHAPASTQKLLHQGWHLNRRHWAWLKPRCRRRPRDKCSGYSYSNIHFIRSGQVEQAANVRPLDTRRRWWNPNHHDPSTLTRHLPTYRESPVEGTADFLENLPTKG
jgi:hypothetical protein